MVYEEIEMKNKMIETMGEESYRQNMLNNASVPRAVFNSVVSELKSEIAALKLEIENLKTGSISNDEIDLLFV